MNRMLRQFLAVAEAGSMSGGAIAALVSQPSLTINMRKLEDNIGVPLFVRTARGVKLTEYGETLYQNTRLMMRLYDNTLKSIKLQRERIEEGIRIGTGYSWWTLFIRKMVIEHSKSHPNARIFVNLGNQLRCMDLLLAGDISMFVAHEIDGLSQDTEVELIPLRKVRGSFFVREGHPLVGRSCTMSDIHQFPLATSAAPEARHQRLLTSWPKTSYENSFEQQHYIFSSNSLAACLDYVRQTDAVISHTELMASEFERLGLKCLTLDEPLQVRTVGIYVLNERIADPKIANLIAMLKQAAEAVPDR